MSDTPTDEPVSSATQTAASGDYVSNVAYLQRATPVTQHSARRQAFMNTVAEAFDKYVDENGQEPEALVFVLNGLKMPSELSWQVTGESAEGMTSILALAAMHMASDIQTKLRR